MFYAMFYGGLAARDGDIEIPDVEPPAFLSLLRYGMNEAALNVFHAADENVCILQVTTSWFPGFTRIPYSIMHHSMPYAITP